MIVVLDGNAHGVEKYKDDDRPVEPEEEKEEKADKMKETKEIRKQLTIVA